MKNNKKITWKNFFELSLLSYFDVYDQSKTIEDLIISILLDNKLIESYKHDMMFQMNIESLRKIDPSIYRNVYIKEVFDDNARSGVYIYRIAWGDSEVLAIRGSEELDDIDQKTGWQDWRDNFDMYTPGPTYQQLVCLHYMHSLNMNKKRYLCGHSKGGNLSLFSTLCANKALFDSILHIFAFNAPGITDSLIRDYEMRVSDKTFLDKITLIENEHDCISSFFNHVKEPIIIKSNTPANSLKQIYENHQLHTMKLEGEDFLVAEKKSVMPKLVHHFINDFFVKLSPQRLQVIVARMDEFFDSGLSKSQLYRVLIYQISKYTNLFDEISYDEVADITFQKLIERRKSKIIYHHLRELRPLENVSAMWKNLKDEGVSRLDDFDIRSITTSLVENYEVTLQNTASNIKQVVTENNRKMVEAIQNIQNRNHKNVNEDDKETQG